MTPFHKTVGRSEQATSIKELRGTMLLYVQITWRTWHQVVHSQDYQFRKSYDSVLVEGWNNKPQKRPTTDYRYHCLQASPYHFYGVSCLAHISSACAWAYDASQSLILTQQSMTPLLFRTHGPMVSEVDLYLFDHQHLPGFVLRFVPSPLHSYESLTPHQHVHNLVKKLLTHH